MRQLSLKLFSIIYFSSCVHSFTIYPTKKLVSTSHQIDTSSHLSRSYNSNIRLYGGRGIATNYTWIEDQYEIDIKIPVPSGIKAKNVQFQAHPTSISLSLRYNKHEEEEKECILLDGSREFRGRIDIDGTFWSISDREKEEQQQPSSEHYNDDTYGREITVTIEKLITPPKDQFEVVDFDWGGVYPEDDDEVSYRKYDEPEELDVREYAASMGVDIDNINMTMVDKSMFSSSINMTRSTMDELTKQGFAQEVTEQNDDLKFLQDDDGKAVPMQDPFMRTNTENGNNQNDDASSVTGTTDNDVDIYSMKSQQVDI